MRVRRRVLRCLGVFGCRIVQDNGPEDLPQAPGSNRQAANAVRRRISRKGRGISVRILEARSPLCGTKAIFRPVTPVPGAVARFDDIGR
jgi:hypothetical protein